MAKKAKDETATTDAPDTTTAPVDEQPAVVPDETAPVEPNEAPEAEDTSDPEVQESQPEEAPEDTTSSPTTEANLTHGEADPTATVPAGSADETADHTADGPHNGTENTLPQSPVHEGDLDEMTKQDIVDDMQEPGAVVGNVAAKYGVTPERVFELLDQGTASTSDEDE